jgi:hypothetical protein
VKVSKKKCYFEVKQEVVIMPDTGCMELVDSGWNTLSDGKELITTLNTKKLDQSNLLSIYGKGDAGMMINSLIKTSIS